MTYNILAECLTDKTKEYPNTRYPYCPEQYLEFKYRYPLIVKEIQNSQSDIVCLQEIDNINIYGKLFKEMGYNYSYLEKNDRKEGIAILYKTEKFDLSQNNSYLYNNYLDPLSKIKDKKEYLEQYQGILHFKLKVKKNGKILNILTTHLHHDPREDHVKYFQASVALMYIKQEITDKNKEEGVIFCGDFNSLPNSNVVQLIENLQKPDQSRVDPLYEKYINFKAISYFYAYFLKNRKLCKLYSAYSNYKGSGGYPEFSNYKESFQGNLDYIFYNQNLKVQKIWDLPSEEQVLESAKGIPNKDFPSDHVPLIAEFLIV